MKKFILSAVAAGALAVGGAASAQDFGAVIGNILGFGTPTYPTYSYPNYGYGGSTPAVVAGTQPYYNNGTLGNHNAYPGNTQVYVDQYGRQVTIDQYGRHVYVQPNTGSYGITGYDQWGRPIYGNATYGYSNRTWDSDGDGVADAQDRWPNDRRYW